MVHTPSQFPEGDTMTESPLVGTAEDPAQADWERAQQRAMSALFAGLGQIEQGIGVTARALDDLTGPLYDIEFVEGHEEGDVRHELDVISRAVRSIRRIAKVRQADWDASGSDPR